MAERIPIPEHLGGGWVDDPGPAPLDARARAWRRWRWASMRTPTPHEPRTTPPQDFCEPWEPREIEECSRFARLKRDE